MQFNRYGKYLYSVNTIIKKDLLQWVRNIQLIVSGCLGPIAMFLLFNYMIGVGKKGTQIFNSGSTCGLLYMVALYTGLFWVGEPLYQEKEYHTYKELVLMPINKSFILVGKLLSGFIKTFFVIMLIFTFISIRLGTVPLNLKSLYFLLLVILNCGALAVVLSGFLSNFAVYATLSGFSGIICVVFGGGLISIKAGTAIYFISDLIPPTYAFRVFQEAASNMSIDLVSLIVAHLLPVLFIIVGMVLHSKRISLN